ncbi:MAG: hypothetical protein AB2733_13045 [Candidatus Thiodiazotropha taylori]
MPEKLLKQGSNLRSRRGGPHGRCSDHYGPTYTPSLSDVPCEQHAALWATELQKAEFVTLYTTTEIDAKLASQENKIAQVVQDSVKSLMGIINNANEKIATLERQLEHLQSAHQTLRSDIDSHRHAADGSVIIR